MPELTPKGSQMPEKAPFWREFFILLGVATLGSVAVIPYQSTLLGAAPEETSMPMLFLLGILQSALFIGVGLLCARRVRLGAPILEGWLQGQEVGKRGRAIIIPSVLLGLGAGLLMIILDVAVFVPRLPSALLAAQVPSPWQGFLGSFYGGINEEILVRLFLVSLLAWLLSRVWKDPEGKPAAGGMWLAIIVASVFFGLLHLPATAQVAPLTPLIVARGVVLNGVAGLAFGYLYWKRGLESAMLAHFSADILLHVIVVPFVT